jgi:hypothetical protein
MHGIDKAEKNLFLILLCIVAFAFPFAVFSSRNVILQIYSVTWTATFFYSTNQWAINGIYSTLIQIPSHVLVFYFIYITINRLNRPLEDDGVLIWGILSSLTYILPIYPVFFESSSWGFPIPLVQLIGVVINRRIKMMKSYDLFTSRELP